MYAHIIYKLSCLVTTHRFVNDKGQSFKFDDINYSL